MKSFLLRTPRPFAKALFLLAGLLLSLWLASRFPDLSFTVLLSALLAFALKPVVRFAEQRLLLRRIPAVILTFVLVVGGLALTGIEFAPPLFHKTVDMYARFQSFPFQQKLGELGSMIAVRVPFVSPQQVNTVLDSSVQTLLVTVQRGVQAALNYIVNLAIVPFITYFFLAEGDEGMRRLIERVPNKYFEMTLNIMHKIQRDLVGYLRGWFLDSAVIGVLWIIGLSILGLDSAIAVGVIAGFANLIPYVGPVVGAAIAVLVSLVQVGGFQLALPIVILTLILRVLDDLVVQPMCYSKTIDMHPVAVIISLLLGHELMGVAGIVLAIPVVTVLRVSTREFYWGLKHYRLTS